MSSSAIAHLTDRIRALVDGDPRITEKIMFGGLTFLLNGHILAGIRKDGSILLSVGKAHYATALARPGTEPMLHGGRTMTGFLFVDADAIEDDEALEEWIRLAERWVSELPVKPPKPSKTPKPR